MHGMKKRQDTRESDPVQAAFDMTDSNGDGHIAADEFANSYVSKMQGHGLNHSQWIHSFGLTVPTVDTNGNGTLEVNGMYCNRFNRKLPVHVMTWRNAPCALNLICTISTGSYRHTLSHGAAISTGSYRQTLSNGAAISTGRYRHNLSHGATVSTRSYRHTLSHGVFYVLPLSPQTSD